MLLIYSHIKCSVTETSTNCFPLSRFIYFFKIYFISTNRKRLVPVSDFQFTIFLSELAFVSRLFGMFHLRVLCWWKIDRKRTSLVRNENKVSMICIIKESKLIIKRLTETYIFVIWCNKVHFFLFLVCLCSIE